MICSCQKQDSTAEAQLAQRKTELDVREETLIQREKAVEEREKAVAEREKALANRRIIQSQRQAPDAAQAEAERQKRIQQLPAELRSLVPPASQVAAGDPGKQQRPAPRQLGPDDLQRQWQSKLDKAQMSGKTVFPAAEAPSPTPCPAVEATSPSPSPTPQ
jgi:uncharacterized protein (DUF3084 family)